MLLGLWIALRGSQCRPHRAVWFENTADLVRQIGPYLSRLFIFGQASFNDAKSGDAKRCQDTPRMLDRIESGSLNGL